MKRYLINVKKKGPKVSETHQVFVFLVEKRRGEKFLLERGESPQSPQAKETFRKILHLMVRDPHHEVSYAGALSNEVEKALALEVEYYVAGGYARALWLNHLRLALFHQQIPFTGYGDAGIVKKSLPDFSEEGLDSRLIAIHTKYVTVMAILDSQKRGSGEPPADPSNKTGSRGQGVARTTALIATTSTSFYCWYYSTYFLWCGEVSPLLNSFAF